MSNQPKTEKLCAWDSLFFLFSAWASEVVATEKKRTGIADINFGHLLLLLVITLGKGTACYHRSSPGTLERQPTPILSSPYLTIYYHIPPSSLSLSLLLHWLDLRRNIHYSWKGGYGGERCFWCFSRFIFPVSFWLCHCVFFCFWIFQLLLSWEAF